MNKYRYLMLFFIFTLSGLVSTEALAFYCTTNGTQTGSGGTIPVSVASPNLKKDTNNNVVITNMATYTTCNGNKRDNLRIYSSSVDSRLATYGFSGVLNIDGTRFDMPATSNYIWPFANSDAVADGTYPIRVTIELKRNATGSWAAGVTLPKGTIIATMVAQQRSDSTWGWPLTWNFVLNAPLVIPGYTCNVTSPDNRTVKLPNADASEIRGIGKGRFTNSKTRFAINLDCDVLATVDLSFGGTTMSGKDDVLKNQGSGGQNFGIQIFPAGSSSAIKFDGVESRVIESAAATETLEYDAYYYYDGGRVLPGQVKASATYTFTYK